MIQPNNRRWRVVKLAIVLLGPVVVADRGGTSSAQSPPPSAPPAAPIQGRVLDAKGVPVAGAVVRLYRKESQWSRRDPQIEEAQVGPDGSFRLTSLPLDVGPPERPNPARLVLVAEHAGHALG